MARLDKKTKAELIMLCNERGSEIQRLHKEVEKIQEQILRVLKILTTLSLKNLILNIVKNFNLLEIKFQREIRLLLCKVNHIRS